MLHHLCTESDCCGCPNGCITILMIHPVSGMTIGEELLDIDWVRYPDGDFLEEMQKARSSNTYHGEKHCEGESNCRKGRTHPRTHWINVVFSKKFDVGLFVSLTSFLGFWMVFSVVLPLDFWNSPAELFQYWFEFHQNFLRFEFCVRIHSDLQQNDKIPSCRMSLI